MPPSSLLSTRALILQHPGGTSRDIIIASFITTLPKTWIRISDINGPKGSSDRGQRSQTGGHCCFIPQHMTQGYRPATDLELILSCDRLFRCLSLVAEQWPEMKAVQG